MLPKQLFVLSYEAYQLFEAVSMSIHVHRIRCGHQLYNLDNSYYNGYPSLVGTLE